MTLETRIEKLEQIIAADPRWTPHVCDETCTKDNCQIFSDKAWREKMDRAMKQTEEEIARSLLPEVADD